MTWLFFMTERIKTNNRQLAPEVDEIVIVELRLPAWMRTELNVRALRAGYPIGKRNDYVKQLFLAAWEQKSE
jgi:hypothetical protein